MQKMAPPPHVARIRRRLPGGATLNIVGPCRPADGEVRVSNKIESGTSAARGAPEGRQAEPAGPTGAQQRGGSLKPAFVICVHLRDLRFLRSGGVAAAIQISSTR